MTEQTINQSSPDLRHAQRNGRTWGIATLAFLLLGFGGIGYLVVSSGKQDTRITALAGVISKQNDLYGQVCKLAGGQVNTDSAAREACARVERGEPAVPIPVVVTGVPGQQGDPGIGVFGTRQIDRCYIEVTLTNGVSTRFGPFCGSDGLIGPTGPTGPSGVTGEPGVSGESGPTGRQGPQGVGIAEVRAASNPCMVDVVLTDDSTRTVGPFCGPPLGEFTMTDENSAVKRCVRDGGSDSTPNYACRPVEPTTTTVTSTTTGVPPLIPTP